MTTRPRLLLYFLLCLLVTGAARGAAPGPAPEAPPPPGSPSDQALWRAGNDLSEQIIVERARATRLQTRARVEEYVARLDALAGDPEKAKAAVGAKEKLFAAWAANTDLLLQQWPVDPTRGCRYDVLNFETALRDDNPGRQAATLPEARTRLSGCVVKARGILRVFVDSCDALEKALRDADAVLAPPATPTSR